MNRVVSRLCFGFELYYYWKQNFDRYGFMMPEKYIRRIGEEMWEGMKVSARYARKSELGPSKNAEKEELNERRWLAQNIQD